MRVKIIKDHLIDPAYFDRMSKLLAEIVRERKTQAIKYEEYLRKIAELAKTLTEGPTPPDPRLKSPGKLALYHNLSDDAELALRVDDAVMKNRRADWRGNIPAENEIK